MAGGRRPNPKGRSTGAAPFLMMPQWMFDSPAYRSLKPGPRALLFELIRRFNGGNNGRVGFGQREMSTALNIASRETGAGYVRELEAKGFIAVAQRGGFNVKAADRRASEWNLTWLPKGEAAATKDFMSWRPKENDGPGKRASKGGKAAPDGAV